MFNPLDFAVGHTVSVVKGVVVSIASSIGHFVMDEAFALAMGGSVVCLMLVMFGSRRAKGWLYWTVAGYIIVEVGKMVLTI